MSKGKYIFTWSHFNLNLNVNLEELLHKNFYTDVTLVSDDLVQFPAHKFVLSASSTVLKDILLNNPHSQPIIYLRGINQVELNSIIKIMYLGKAQVHQKRIDAFFDVGRQLKIKQLSQLLIQNEDVVHANLRTSPVKNTGHNDEKEVKLSIDQVISTTAETFESNHFKNVIKNEISKQTFKCEICGENFKSKARLNQHIKNKHKQCARYKCEICEHTATRKIDLKKHKESIHDGVRYSCNCCSYMATEVGSLKTHKKSVHEGLRFPCNSCNYKATQLSSLKTHKESVHKGVRYFCVTCNYQASTRSGLLRHKKAVHEGVRYSCDSCDYEATQMSCLKIHKQAIHEAVRYSCNFCEYGATKQSNLQRHTKIMHRNVTAAYL